jgi:5'-3' exonuclease
MTGPVMKIHLVDGTYELFRAYFSIPSLTAPDGRSVGAVLGLVQTLLSLLRGSDVSHVACAFDHQVQSFRNSLFAGYKTGEDTPGDLLRQFDLAERAAAALGLAVWPMVEFEADDALASAAARWRDAPGVEQVVICSPDKDLTQMVQGRRVVCLDRRRNLVMDEGAVVEKFGVSPESIPDYLALVGDTADGIPGIPKWGPKTAGLVLRSYAHIENIPDDATQWQVPVRGAPAIAASLAEHRREAILYKSLATLRLDVPIDESLEDLEWRGVRKMEFEALCSELSFTRVAVHDNEWAPGG